MFGPHLHTPLDRYLRLIEGEGGGSGGGGGAAATTTTGNAAAGIATGAQQAAAPTFTQAQVDAAATAAAAKAKSDLDAYLADEKAKQDRAKLEGEEKLKAELADAQAKLTAAEANAARTASDSAARIALIAAGMPAATVEDGLKLVGHDTADDAAALTAKAEALKVRLPALFADTEADPEKPRRPVTVGGTKPPANKGLGGKSLTELGAELRKEHRLKPPTAA